MPKLIINRKNEWINRLRAYKIFVNDIEIGKINNDKSLTFDIPEGLTTIEAKIDWCGSNTLVLNLSQDEIKNISVQGFKWNFFNMYFKIFYYTIINRKAYLTLTEE